MERKQLKFAVRGASNPAILSLPGGMVVGSFVYPIGAQEGWHPIGHPAFSN